jgi:sulfoxide reductase heme-binding subunit YedZ
MRDWLMKNWRGLLLNGTALAIMITLLAQGSGPDAGTLFDPLFEYSGKWAIRFLLFSLAMTPLNIVFKWRWPLRLRKPAGLWAFAFAALHYTVYTEYKPLNFAWLNVEFGGYIILGAAALLILTAMAITSNRWAMRWLGKWWKRLHRLVYGVALLVTVHAIWGFTSGKKGFFRPGDTWEFYLYLMIVIALLLARVPMVRRWFRRRPVRPVKQGYATE